MKLIRNAVLAIASLTFVLGASSTASAAKLVSHPKVLYWYAHQGGSKALNKVGTDVSTLVSNLDTAIADPNGAADGAYTTADDDCAALYNDASTDLDGAITRIPPVPMKSLEKTWSTMLTDFYQYGSACVLAIGNNSPTSLNAASTTYLIPGEAAHKAFDTQLLHIKGFHKAP